MLLMIAKQKAFCNSFCGATCANVVINGLDKAAGSKSYLIHDFISYVLALRPVRRVHGCNIGKLFIYVNRYFAESYADRYNAQ